MVAAPPPPPPPPSPAPPRNVSPTALEANRTSGDREVTPDDATRDEIARAGKPKLVAAFKLCIDVAGAVTNVVQLKSSGFPAYDAKIMARIRTWQYRPFLVDGKPSSVCSTATFIHSQPAPAPPHTP